MNFDIKLNQFSLQLKNFLLAYLVVLSIGILTGLYYVSSTTKTKIKGIIEHWNGSEVLAGEIPEQYEKGIQEMLMTTHNHILGFSFIILQVGIIFYFNSIVKNKLKSFLLIEPFISTLLTFGGIWLIRFAHHNFVYLIIFSAAFMYMSLFTMIFISMYELMKKS